MKARFYILNGKPVTNEKLRHKKLKEWEENCVEVENVFENRVVFDKNGSRIGIMIPGQLVEVEGKIITKIY